LNLRAANRGEYDQRMHRVLQYIDQRLEKALPLTELADVAHFSPFHFHRLFTAWTGETLGDYLRRRRMEVAAMRLVAQPRLTVLQAALSVGFGSGEAFARAFKARFGESASAWRRHQRAHRLPRSNLDQPNRKLDQAFSERSGEDVGTATHAPEPEMNVKLIDRPPALIAYLRHVGPYGAPIGAFWQQHVYPWMQTNDLLHLPRYGISHDDPNITQPAQCRYDAGVEIPVQREFSGPALRATIPGGRFATAYFKGTVDTIANSWQAVLRDWLPPSGLQLDNRPAFEYYPPGSSYDPATGVFDCEICIPVIPL
jgi:AraC family transcriptional regulator